MEFREPPGPRAYHSTANRPLSCYALYSRRNPGLLLCEAHFPGREWGLAPAEGARQWGQFLFYLPVQTRGPGPLLRQLYICKDLNYRGGSPPPCHSGRVSRLCVALGPNKLLGGHRDYKSILCLPLFRA